MSTFEELKRKREDGNQSVYSTYTTEGPDTVLGLHKQNTNRSYTRSINEEEEQDNSYIGEVQDSFVEKMKSIRQTGRDNV